MQEKETFPPQAPHLTTTHAACVSDSNHCATAQSRSYGAMTDRVAAERHRAFSSIEIYGDPAGRGYRGNLPCTSARGATTSPSVSARHCAFVSAKQRGIPVGIARPFNNYGPELKINDGRVVPNFGHRRPNGRLRDRYLSFDVTMISFSLLVHADRRLRGFGEELAGPERCRYPGCGMFFQLN
jgi:hypothetical protein